MISSLFILKQLKKSRAFAKLISLDDAVLKAYLDRLSPETLQDFAHIVYEEAHENHEILHKHKKRNVQLGSSKKRKIQQLSLKNI